MYFFRIIMIIWSCASINIGHAQRTFQLTKDTARAPFKCDYYTNTSLPYNQISIEKELQGLQWYNLLQNNQYEFQSAGTMGIAARPILYESPFVEGFQFGLNQLDAYKLTDKNTRYYTTNKPFVDLDFLFGAKASVLINVRHAQNLSKRASYGMHYQRITSTGAYANNQTLHNSTSIYLQMYSKQYIYFTRLEFILNDMRTRDNGGITAPIAGFGGGLIKSFVPVNLVENNTKHYDLQWNYTHHFYLQKMDSSKSNLYDRSHFEVKATYKNFDQITSDKKPDTFYDAAIQNWTGDLNFFYHAHRIGGEVSYSQYVFLDKVKFLRDRGLSKLMFKPYGRLESIVAYAGNRNGAENAFVNTLIGADLGNLNRDLVIQYSQGISGYNQRDFNFSAKIPLILHDKIGKIYGQFQLFSKTPDFFANNVSSDFLSWANDFNALKSTSFKFIYHLPTKEKSHIQFKMAFLNNAIYYDSTLLPKQDSAGFRFFSVDYRGQWKIKHFGLSADLVIQNHNSNIISIPKLWTKISTFYYGNIFKRNLSLQIGVDTRYTGNYTAYSYSPFISQFVLQGTNTWRNSPIFDVFLNAKIRSLAISLKMNDVIEGLINQSPNYNYSLYPTQGRGFDVYISWRFLN